MYDCNCDGYCQPSDLSTKDREAILKEQEAILEAKLATVRHMRDNLKSEKQESDKK